jgi:acyl-CoA synthetase (NDP forming)
MEMFFDPKSIVVIGASNAPFNLGATICNMLKDYLQYAGAVYALNLKGETVNGYPGYSSILELPETPDLAVIIVAARNVPGIIKDCAVKGIKRIIIETAGFSEGGEDGKAMQQEIDDIARANGIRIMGPNCLGTLSTRKKFCCFYGVNPSLVEMSQIFEVPGNISYIIQSGGVAVLVMESLYYDVVGVNKVVSIGNKCDVDEADLIDYFQNDETEVIGIYLENVANGRKLMDAAKKSRKPILIYKVGKTPEGAMAAMSHTAGMANNDSIFDSACRQAGIIRLQSIDELHSLPKMFTEMPLLKGKRIAMFTNSGAFGSIAADLLVEAGLQMVHLSSQTQEKLKKAGKAFNIKNPVDIGPAPPQTYLDIFEILLAADEVDGLLPLLSVWQPFVIDTLLELMKICKRYDKPAAIYTANAIAKSIAIRAKHRIPIFETSEQAVRALSVSHAYYESLLKRNFISAPASNVASGLESNISAWAEAAS